MRAPSSGPGAASGLGASSAPGASSTPGDDAFSPGAAWWERFVADCWDADRPAVLRQPLAQPLATPGDLLHMFRGIADRFRSGAPAGGLLFCIEYASKVTEIARHLPDARDASLDAWAARTSEELGGRRFALVAHAPHVASFEHWSRARSFTRGLGAATSLEGYLIDTEIFVGDYLVTPQGVHVDATNAFSFVVQGRKRMLVWPPHVFAGSPHKRSPRSMGGSTYIDDLDYAPYRSQAVVLEGEPGDVLYWPATWWHVGESTGGLAATFNISVLRGQLPMYVAQKRLADPATQAELAGLAGVERQAQGDLDALVGRSVEVLAGGESERRLRRWLTRFWMNHLTGARFATPPAPRAGVSMSVRLVVRADPRYPIRWRAVEDATVISANGHAIELPGGSGAGVLIDELNRGEPASVAALLERHAGIPVAEVRALLKWLLEVQALTS
ncbi:cupin-like domain-containing protein [Sorangium sp. So ce269]